MLVGGEGVRVEEIPLGNAERERSSESEGLREGFVDVDE